MPCLELYPGYYPQKRGFEMPQKITCHLVVLFFYAGRSMGQVAFQSLRDSEVLIP